MNSINNTLNGLEFAQIGWVVPDIHAAVKFLSISLGVSGFPTPELMNAQQLGMSFHGQLLAGEWLTTQTYNGGSFIELIQPVSGQSMFSEYLKQHPAGGTQHIAFRLPVNDFERVTSDLQQQGFEIISAVDHPIARMMFFDTYQTLGVVTEIMGITKEGEKAIEQMKQMFVSTI